jgi:general stress protein 26
MDVRTERQRVRALIERAGVTVLMNVDEKGTHVGRPMLPLLVESDPHIYFLTHQNSRKVTQLAVRPQVGVSIISANCVVVVAGSAQLSRDSELIRRLWRPTYRAWFPEGKDDREATVSVHEHLTGIRARNAVHALRSSTEKVEAVALMVGYTSKKDLYRTIRAMTGLTPKRLRSDHVRIRMD